MITSAALTAKFEQALSEGWGYIWGKRGQVWTAAAQAASTRTQTKQHGSQWIGRRVADCSGLFVWAFQELDEYIYHGSNTIWEKHTKTRGTLAGRVTLRAGMAVFQVSGSRRTHIGLYAGNGRCIEAKSTRLGVVESDISEWDEWAELAAVDYTASPAESLTLPRRTLRKGAQGTDVYELQQLLSASGYTCKADGIFGAATFSAVKEYQAAMGLTSDGVVGPATWETLEAPAPAPTLPTQTLEERVAALEDAVGQILNRIA